MGKVSATRGWQWIVQAVTLVGRHASVFVLMGLIVAGIYLIPLIGGLIMLVVGPALIGGAVVAARDAAQGARPSVSQLFTLFQREGRARDALKLCVPLVVGKLLASFVVGIGMLRIAKRAGLDIKTLETQTDVLMKTLQGSTGDLIWWFLAAVLILLVAWALSVIAIARVALDDAEPFAAMVESFHLARRNAGAWLLAALVLLVGVFVLAMPVLLGGHMVLAQLVIHVVIYSLLGPWFYFAWRDLCPRKNDDTPSPPPSPSPSPSSSASSSGTFEA